MTTIWIVNQYIPPPLASANGAARHLHLARYLSRQGYQVVLLSGALSFQDGKTNHHLDENQAHRDFKEQNVRMRLFRGRPYGGLLGRFLSMRQFERRVLSGVQGLPQPDLVIGSSVHLYAARAGLRLSRRFGVPFMFEVRDIWPRTIADTLPIARLTPLYWALRLIEIQLYRKAERILSLLPRASEHVARSFADPAKVYYLPNMVDISPYLRPDYPTPPQADTFTVLYTGSMIPACALNSFIEAAAIVASDHASLPIRFRLVGNGVERPMLENMVRELNLSNVEFDGPVPREQVPNEIARADVLYASFRRLPVVALFGMSMNKVYEYLGGARPIILCADSANDPIAQAGAGLSVAAENPRAIADAVITLFNTPYGERVAMGQRGREFARANCSSEVIGARFKNIVDETLAGESPGTRVHPIQIASKVGSRPDATD